MKLIVDILEVSVTSYKRGLPQSIPQNNRNVDFAERDWLPEIPLRNVTIKVTNEFVDVCCTLMGYLNS